MIVPDVVLVGHLALDVQPDGRYQLGGTVTYAGILAARLGLRVGVLTAAPAEDAARLQAALPEAQIVAISSATPTIFHNRYHQGHRTQWLRSRAADLTAADLPAGWESAPLTFFGPLAGEVGADLVAASASPWRLATPQGWLRRWDESGLVWPQPWQTAAAILPHLTTLVLSVEDLAVAAGSQSATALLHQWSQVVPQVVLTAGASPARLWLDGQEESAIPTCAASEVDPTGAGDCFALALLVHLWRTGNLTAAVRFAHAVAAFVVEGVGTDGIPTAAAIDARWNASSSL